MVLDLDDGMYDDDGHFIWWSAASNEIVTSKGESTWIVEDKRVRHPKTALVVFVLLSPISIVCCLFMLCIDWIDNRGSSDSDTKKSSKRKKKRK